MNGRTAFTMIELLVVVGIIAILGGILLPVINKAYKSAQVAGMKLNFHTLTTALESYRQDFGDYPRNPFAITDPIVPAGSTPAPDMYRPLPPRTDPTLAMALLGPGPANATNGYTNGDVDGADGPGFRTKMAVYAQGIISSATGTMVTLSSVTPSPLPTIPTPGVQPQFTAISIGQPGSPDAVVPIVSVSGTTIKLARQLYGNGNSYAGAPCSLLIPAGKAWDGYIKADQFKVAYIQVPAASQPKVFAGITQYETQPLPVLLDVWGGPILYFPVYNAITGRQPLTTGINQSTTPTVTSTTNLPTSPVLIPAVAAPLVSGPILGSPSTMLTGATYNFSANSPVDTAKDTIPSIYWSGGMLTFYHGTTQAVPFTLGQVQAVLVKLGDLNANNAIDSPLANGLPVSESFNAPDPFFLMSAGPDGNFTDLTGAAQQYWLQLVHSGDDVYSFDQ